MSRSQWLCGLRRRSADARLLGLWVRIQAGAWMSLCRVLSGRGLCDELITRPEESYRLWCVAVCDLENLLNEEALAHWGLSRQKKYTYIYIYMCVCVCVCVCMQTFSCNLSRSFTTVSPVPLTTCFTFTDLALL